MKVIAGIPWKLDWEISGFSKRIKGCFSAITDKNVDIKLYCHGPVFKEKRFSTVYLPSKKTAVSNLYSLLMNSLAFSHEFSKKVDREKYDVLHCFNTTSFYLKNKKYLFQTTNPTYAFALDSVKDEYPNTSKYQKLLNYYKTVSEIEKTEYENAELIISNTEVVKNNIAKYHKIDKKKIEVIPNGVSPQECSFKKNLSNTGEMKIILFPGTVQVMKGFRYLVKAMDKIKKEFPSSILLICGRIHGYEDDIFKKLIYKRQKERGIILKGFLPREQLFKYYHMADVCCIPLIFGTMSIAILESVAHGLPIVTTEHSGFPEVNEVGIKVPPKDSNAIAEAIISLLSDPELLMKKSRNAKKIIKKYFWNSIANKFLKVYKKM